MKIDNVKHRITVTALLFGALMLAWLIVFPPGSAQASSTTPNLRCDQGETCVYFRNDTQLDVQLGPWNKYYDRGGGSATEGVEYWYDGQGSNISMGPGAMRKLARFDERHWGGTYVAKWKRPITINGTTRDMLWVRTNVYGGFVRVKFAVGNDSWRSFQSDRSATSGGTYSFGGRNLQIHASFAPQLFGSGNFLMFTVRDPESTAPFVPHPLNAVAAWNSVRAASSKSSGLTLSGGEGVELAAGVSRSAENGKVYGPNGEFGRYRTICDGYRANISASGFHVEGQYPSWDNFEGSSYVVSMGVSVPGTDVGVGASAVLDRRGGNVIGVTESVSLGVGALPLDFGGATCNTELEQLLINGDTDFDGTDDGTEMLNGTNPFNSEDPAVQSSLRFGGVVSLRSYHGRHLVAESNGAANANRRAIGAWEKWTVINPANTSDRRAIRYGDVVSLRSHHGKYLVAERDGTANANRRAIGAWEKWTVINPANPNDRSAIQERELISLRSYHGKYLVAERNGAANANRTAIGGWEKWTILKP